MKLLESTFYVKLIKNSKIMYEGSKKKEKKRDVFPCFTIFIYLGTLGEMFSNECFYSNWKKEKVGRQIVCIERALSFSNFRYILMHSNRNEDKF